MSAGASWNGGRRRVPVLLGLLFQLADFTGQSLEIRLEVGVVLLDLCQNSAKIRGKRDKDLIAPWAVSCGSFDFDFADMAGSEFSGVDTTDI